MNHRVSIMRNTTIRKPGDYPKVRGCWLTHVQTERTRVQAKILGPVWYMCLKIENCYLKIFVEIRVSEKMCGHAWNAV